MPEADLHKDQGPMHDVLYTCEVLDIAADMAGELLATGCGAAVLHIELLLGT
jgi:hypothetical protein